MRYKDRQEQAADFKDTRLTKPNTSAAEAEQQGVVNQYDGKLMGQSLGDIGEGLAKGVKAVEDFKEGYDLAKISQEQAALNELYLNGTTKAQIAEQEQNEQAAMQTEERMWNNFHAPQVDGNGDKIVDSINLATKNAGDAQAKLGRMKAQGKIGVDEFVARSTLLTKQQIARHPRLADEILAQTDKQWKISNIRDRVNLDHAASKSAAAEIIRQKSGIETAYRKAHPDVLYNDDQTINYIGMKSAMMKQAIHLDRVTSAANITAIEGIDATEKVRQLNKPDDDGVTGFQAAAKETRIMLFQNTRDIIKSIDVDGSPSNRSDVNAQFKLLTARERRRIQEFYSRLIPNKEAEARQTNALAELTAYETDMSNQILGKEAADISTSLTTSLHNEETNNIFDKTNMTPRAMTAFAAMVNLIPTKIRVGDEELTRGIYAQGKKLNEYAKFTLGLAINGVPINDERKNRKLRQIPHNPKATNELTKATNKALQEDPDNEVLERVFNSTFLLKASHIGDSDTEQGRVDEFDDALNAWSDPDMLESHVALTDETKIKANEVVDKALGTFDNSVKTSLKRLKGMGVQIEATLSGGTLVFSEAAGGTGNNTHEARLLTNNISVRVTKARKAIANINGLIPNNSQVTEMILNRMPVLRGLLEPQEEKKEQVKKKRFL